MNIGASLYCYPSKSCSIARIFTTDNTDATDGMVKSGAISYPCNQCNPWFVLLIAALRLREMSSSVLHGCIPIGFTSQEEFD